MHEAVYVAVIVVLAVALAISLICHCARSRRNNTVRPVAEDNVSLLGHSVSSEIKVHTTFIDEKENSMILTPQTSTIVSPSATCLDDYYSYDSSTLSE